MSLRCSEGKAAKNVTEALIRAKENLNISDSETSFKRNKLLLKYDLIKGLSVFHFWVFLNSKIISFLQLLVKSPRCSLNKLSTSESVKINILEKVSLLPIL